VKPVTTPAKQADKAPNNHTSDTKTITIPVPVPAYHGQKQNNSTKPTEASTSKPAPVAPMPTKLADGKKQNLIVV
jgi:hypothetical protein